MTEHKGWFNAVFNPVVWNEVEKSRQAIPTEQPSLTNMLRFMTDDRLAVDLERYIYLYDFAAEMEGWTPIHVAPNHPQIVDKMLAPLRHAKASFMLGNFIGTIALCGMIAEIVAILRYEIEDDRIAAEGLESVERFESFGQDQRVRYLKKKKIVTDPMVLQWFDVVRETRRQHLHFFSPAGSDPTNDAVTCYRIAHALVSWIIGNRHEQALPEVNPGLVKWLDRKGLFHEEKPDKPSEQTGEQGPPKE